MPNMKFKSVRDSNAMCTVASEKRISVIPVTIDSSLMKRPEDRKPSQPLNSPRREAVPDSASRLLRSYKVSCNMVEVCQGITLCGNLFIRHITILSMPPQATKRERLEWIILIFQQSSKMNLIYLQPRPSKFILQHRSTSIRQYDEIQATCISFN